MGTKSEWLDCHPYRFELLLCPHESAKNPILTMAILLKIRHIYESNQQTRQMGIFSKFAYIKSFVSEMPIDFNLNNSSDWADERRIFSASLKIIFIASISYDEDVLLGSRFYLYR